jgi:hypothetical protein
VVPSVLSLGPSHHTHIHTYIHTYTHYMHTVVRSVAVDQAQPITVACAVSKSHTHRAYVTGPKVTGTGGR